MEKDTKIRFWEIDSLRGIAITMMAIYHLVYDLSYFAHYNINAVSGFWLYFARATANTFIFLVGVSLSISFSRAVKKGRDSKKLFIKYLQRGLKVFFWGLIITFVTWFLVGEGYVIFGILHLIGISIILAFPFLKLRFWNLLIGTACIFFGIYIKNLTVNFSWLLWLGFRTDQFYTVDYFPLLPWFGVVLLGIFCGSFFYPDYSRKFPLTDFSYYPPIKALSFLGKHSLFIYLIHQPIIIALLYIFGIVNINL
ncbi:MAG: heparan-alpha-glucosaminide N-acetyltransferase [Candidatus Caldatribacteriota bacterium]|nr:heparan-alpha-glucosaminide N-acetyltransferase [Candidatus Caldatribacteriota bacterium]